MSNGKLGKCCLGRILSGLLRGLYSSLRFDCTSSRIKLVQGISAENMKSPCLCQRGESTRVSATSPKVDMEGWGGEEEGEKNGMGAFFCVSGQTLIMLP